MVDSVATPAPLQLPTLWLGPQSSGRGYQVLAQSGPLGLTGAEEKRLGDLALALAGWADSGEDSFHALIPLQADRAPAVLIHAAYIGSSTLGAVAQAHGVLLDATALECIDGRADLLIPFLPRPDGSRGFADSPIALSMPLAGSELAHDWSHFGLSWRDRAIVDVPAPLVPDILASALAAIDPPDQAARVRGWATTAALPAVADFSPRLFQLLVLDTARAVAPSNEWLRARLTETGFEGDAVTSPDAWRAWRQLQAIADAAPDTRRALGRLRWTLNSAGHDGATMLRIAASALLRQIEGEAQIALLLRLATTPGDFLKQRRSLAQHLFIERVSDASVEHAAFYVTALCAAPAIERAALGDVSAGFLRDGLGSWLTAQTVTETCRMGLLAALARRPDALMGFVADMPDDALTPMIADALGQPDDRLAILGVPLMTIAAGRRPLPSSPLHLQAAVLLARLYAMPAADTDPAVRADLTKIDASLLNPAMLPAIGNGSLALLERATRAGQLSAPDYIRLLRSALAPFVTKIGGSHGQLSTRA